MSNSAEYYTSAEVIQMFNIDAAELKILLAEDPSWKKIRTQRKKGRLYFEKSDTDQFRQRIFAEPTMTLPTEEELG